MALDAISESYAALFAAMRPRTGNSHASDGKEFAAFLPDDTQVQPTPAKSDMVSRILLVGILRYAEEQKEVEKMMWILSLVHIESDDEVRAELDKIVEQFKKNEPANGEDTLTRIKAYIDEMPNGAVKLRMLKAFERITELMAKSTTIWRIWKRICWRGARSLSSATRRRRYRARYCHPA